MLFTIESMSMRKSKTFIFCLLIGFNSLAYANKVIELAFAEWPPAYSKDLPHNGSQFELTEKALIDAGFKVKPVWYNNWSTAFKSAQLGRNHGTPGWECNQERTQDFYFSDPIGTDIEVFFHRKDSPVSFEDFNDLSRIEVIGITEGYFYGDFFDKLVKKNKITTVTEKTEKANFNKLLVGRIDAFIVDKEAGLTFLKEYYTKEQQDLITFHPKPVSTTYLRLLLNKKDPIHKDMILKFNESLRKLNLVKDSETYLTDEMRYCVTQSMKD